MKLCLCLIMSLCLTVISGGIIEIKQDGGYPLKTQTHLRESFPYDGTFQKPTYSGSSKPDDYAETPDFDTDFESSNINKRYGSRSEKPGHDHMDNDEYGDLHEDDGPYTTKHEHKNEEYETVESNEKKYDKYGHEIVFEQEKSEFEPYVGSNEEETVDGHRRKEDSDGPHLEKQWKYHVDENYSQKKTNGEFHEPAFEKEERYSYKQKKNGRTEAEKVYRDEDIKPHHEMDTRKPYYEETVEKKHKPKDFYGPNFSNEEFVSGPHDDQPDDNPKLEYLGYQGQDRTKYGKANEHKSPYDDSYSEDDDETSLDEKLKSHIRFDRNFEQPRYKRGLLDLPVTKKPMRKKIPQYI